jgi:hypothetical protein
MIFFKLKNFFLCQFLERALQIEPDNCQVLNVFGDLLLHSGDIENAAKVLQRSIELEPDAGPEKYMNYGQAVGGDDAALAYQKGIELMQRDLGLMTVNEDDFFFHYPYSLFCDHLIGSAAVVVAHAQQNEDEILNQRKALCSAYCSIAELYLTDLWFVRSHLYMYVYLITNRCGAWLRRCAVWCRKRKWLAERPSRRRCSSIRSRPKRCR